MSNFAALSTLQYVPGDSILHRLDPRSKYGFFASYSISLVSSHSFTASLIYTLFALFLFLLSRLRLYLLLESIRGLLIVIIIINYFQIILNGIEAATLLTLKMISFILTVTLILSTTPPEKLMEGLRKLLSPLRRLGVKSESCAVMFTVAVIYLPLLLEDLMRIMQAQRVRGAQYGRWNLAGRGRDMILLLTPLLLMTFRRADRLSDAMESRCYMPGSERTAFYYLKWGRLDFIVLILALLLPLIHFKFE
ncbi:energy-coupling factor transporter transmembrane component T family protein [Cohnella cholangitidis]|uniref:Energy-coupling factor transporter transmembrane protein EcfT n=1 Tax=Cohnella cholangitidis TaxID=2598458 RepID=A0A7G5C6F1_9BACL|nr:energy-coupling factor transporter transmembrane protein EcfT [Cohnella cholangitidis]QMV44785.1 energy-coupling factor transporter transmembrane protein EcfT [Cohnella cholangitidis]